MGDAFATPLFAEALNRHRGAVIDLNEQYPLWSLRLRTDCHDHTHIHRWEPWVRAYLAAEELLRGLKFRCHSHPGENQAEGRFEVRLSAYDEVQTNEWLTAVTIVRPPERVFRGQIRRVLSWAELRDERMLEILAQIDNQHCFWGTLIPIQSDRLRHTRELLDAAIQFAVSVSMRFKHELACWRPIDYSSQVQPIITTPGHGSLPCGHCTQVYTVFEVLKSLLQTQIRCPGAQSLNLQFARTAERVSINRVIAGLHFPVDNVAGRMLGTVLGEYFVYRCGYWWSPPGSKGKEKVPKAWNAARFDGSAFPEDEDFDPMNQNLFKPGCDAPYYAYHAPHDPGDNEVHLRASPANSVLSALWDKAVEEVKLLDLRFEEGDEEPQ